MGDDLVVTYLGLLANELHQLAGVLRPAGEEISRAAREVALAPADRLGPPSVDAAGNELVGGASVSLCRLAVAVGDVENLLHRLAISTDDAADATGPYGPEPYGSGTAR